jgi:hypothetical protein
MPMLAGGRSAIKSLTRSRPCEPDGRASVRPTFNEAGVTEVCGGSSIVKFNGEKGLIVTVFLLRIE